MIFQLDIPIYGTNVLFVVSPTKEEMDEFLSVKQNRQKLTEEEFTTLFTELDNTEYGGYTTPLDSGEYLVLIKDNYKDPVIFTHELFHVTNLILFDREIEHTRTDEPYAYLLGWIAGQYCNYIKMEEEKQGNQRNPEL